MATSRSPDHGVRALRRFVESIDQRLIARTSRQLAERFSITVPELEKVLAEYSAIVEKRSTTNLWGYKGEPQPIAELPVEVAEPEPAAPEQQTWLKDQPVPAYPAKKE